MKKINFKIYDCKDKKFVENRYVGFCGFYVNQNGEWLLVGSTKLWDKDSYPRNYIPILGTGVKDKNEVEIYDGDILICINRKKNKTYIKKHIVRWGEGGFLLPKNVDKWEVRGNVLKNKEFLYEFYDLNTREVTWEGE